MGLPQLLTDLDTAWFQWVYVTKVQLQKLNSKRMMVCDGIACIQRVTGTAMNKLLQKYETFKNNLRKSMLSTLLIKE